MTSVRIVVEDPILGRVEVEEDDRVGSYRTDTQRAAIGRLLGLAEAKVRRAYQLDGPTPEVSS